MCWQLRSGLDDTHPLENHIQAILAVIETRAKECQVLWPDHDLVLQCVGYFPTRVGSGVHLDREVVRKAGLLGLAIDFDHYFVEDHGHAP